MSTEQVHAKVYPIGFSIPESKIVAEIPTKERDFSFIYPGRLDTYIYEEEQDYYYDYQRSYFAVTKKKGGWDCLRHYEILANGCIPYFLNLDKCPPMSMHYLPKDLIQEAMNLPGVSYLQIDHEKFDTVRYYEILHQLLEHTRTYLTTAHMADYLLKTMNYNEMGKVLFLSNDNLPDYLRSCTLIGMKQRLQERVIDVPKMDHIYTNYDKEIQELYGKGMTYTKVIEDCPLNRENIEQRIQLKEFDLIIYGCVHENLPFHDLVLTVYDKDQIAYICGNDAHQCPYVHLPHLFLREFDTYVNQPSPQ